MNEILKFSANRIKPCPSSLIIAPTQSLLRLVREELNAHRQKLTQLQLIADSIALYTCEKISVIGPVIGRNAINLALAPLLLERINNVILVSVAGSKNLEIGQIVQGEEFYTESEERYLANSKLENIEAAKVLTINNPYLENINFLNCELIEMEASEVARLCIENDKKFNTLFCISDTFKNESWQHGFNSEKFHSSLKELIKLSVFKALENKEH